MKIKSFLISSFSLLCGCGAPNMLVKKGDAFPEFELSSHTGIHVTKSDLLGQPSVVWFYPKAATPG
ncbi:MAG TPA: redoxin domain-containing protein [Planctomycetes bacterium]|jgi:hypothetical protein|nr:redoxin domain-containing protein [Planctomycetota bacterium]